MVRNKDNVDLICDIAELAGLFERSSSLNNFMDTATRIIAWHMKAAVCSIYLFDESSQELVLQATQGLDPSAVGQVRLKLGEGITGTALKELRPICEGRGSKNPSFKHIPGIQEERYEAFLAVPILRNLERIGVLVAQDPEPNYFDDNDIKALRAISGQLATTIENAKLLMSVHELTRAQQPPGPSNLPRFIRGIQASEGIAIGTAASLSTIDDDVLRTFDQDPTPRTLDDFHRAMKETEEQLSTLQRELEERLSDVASLIFSAHLLILKDDSFSGTIVELIEKGTPPQKAVSMVMHNYIRLFSNSKNPRLQEKVLDLKDLGHRLLLNLMSHNPDLANYEGQIIVTRELLPSDLLKLAAQKVAGLILLSGNITSHVAILSRSLNIPAIMIDDPQLGDMLDGRSLIVDALQGTLFIEPDPDVRSKYDALLEERNRLAQLEPAVLPETQTRDGVRITLSANINLLSDMQTACRLKAEGIGLYRSEFPFIVRDNFPSEEEQYRIYRRIMEGMEGRAVTLRTLDIGGDKTLPYLTTGPEANPFLGLRAIRFSLRNRAVFSQQLRAMLRAGTGYPLRILFPLVSSVDDFTNARDVVHACMKELEDEQIPYQRETQLGAMIELPSAVELIEELARECDFVSIGTNDLIQYLLAVDRTNEMISDLYLPYHPAVLRALYRVAKAAQKHGIDASVCGDVASDPAMLPFLLGCGIRRLSVDSRNIPRLQNAIAELDLAEATRKAEQAILIGRVSEVAEFLGVGPR